MGIKEPINYLCFTAPECNHAPIEKELLAIVFACNKFHHYIYGFLYKPFGQVSTHAAEVTEVHS